jgi:hypothetical protein
MGVRRTDQAPSRARKVSVRLLAAIVLCVGLLALSACGGDDSRKQPPRPSSLLGIVWSERNELAELNPLSLRPLPDRRRVAIGPGPWAMSPDGKQLAVGKVTSVRLVDLTRMRLRGDIALGRSHTEALAWLEGGSLLVLRASDLGVPPHGEVKRELAVVDPVRLTVLQRHPVDGSVERWAWTRDGVVLLLGSSGRIGPTRLAVFDLERGLRDIPLARIPAGWTQEKSRRGETIDRRRSPGLAVDPEGGRAFVVDPADFVAEVDLSDLNVAYHDLRERVSLLGRLRNWLEPAARADGGGGFTGPVRHALWLGGGIVAVSGWNDRLVDAGGYLEQRSTPAGVTLVDTSDWTTRKIDEDASDITLADDALLAYGSLWDGSAWSGIGVRVYSRDGERRFELFDGEPIFTVQATGGYAYPQLENSCRGWVVDLRSERVLRELDFNPNFDVSSSCDWPSLLDG